MNAAAAAATGANSAAAYGNSAKLGDVEDAACDGKAVVAADSGLSGGGCGGGCGGGSGGGGSAAAAAPVIARSSP